MMESMTLNREESDEVDKFYTKSWIAEKFVQRVDSFIDLNSYDIVLEPSAGNGRILDCLPEDKRVGVDLHPERDDITQSDFFDYYPPDNNPLLFQTSKIATIGNPPFGKSSSIAIPFFNHAANFSDTVAFIIPWSWIKHSIHKKLDNRFSLYWEAILPSAAFTFMDRDYSINCVAQMWCRNDPKPSEDKIHREDWR